MGWLWALQLAPEEAAVTRMMRGQSCAELSCAGGTGLCSALLSDFSHHRQFHFKGAAASQPFALLPWGKMQKAERVNHLVKQRELEGNDYCNEMSTTTTPAFPKPPETPGEKSGCSAQKEARGCLAEVKSIKGCSKLLLNSWYLSFLTADYEMWRCTHFPR